DPKGSHGQQRICLEAFVEAMIEQTSEEQPLRKTLIKLQKTVRDDNYFFEVRSEEPTLDRRRMDIVVNIGGKNGIVIENKPWANDQKDALGDYADEAARRFSDCWVLIYLHGTGKAVDEYTISKKKLRKLEKDGNFFNTDYTYFLIRWLKICLERVEAEKIRCFLRDFIDCIEQEFRSGFFNEEINNE
ncbi:MAG TPA: PD-(D/E)XK nuclease family protein, partial [Candidatus Competibacter sp.]|nr:PD-(D/E)XK nuclease family protein [Candidatus Competibacter sp.]